mmetsp:Transcript_21051/g.54471  ORF Transcript_21051/g.54471 Transcript_21051/m.54471 type:complete len:234 (+) Transcript_21051:9642-10343(+)
MLRFPVWTERDHLHGKVGLAVSGSFFFHRGPIHRMEGAEGTGSLRDVGTRETGRAGKGRKGGEEGRRTKGGGEQRKATSPHRHNSSFPADGGSRGGESEVPHAHRLFLEVPIQADDVPGLFRLQTNLSRVHVAKQHVEGSPRPDVSRSTRTHSFPSFGFGFHPRCPAVGSGPFWKCDRNVSETISGCPPSKRSSSVDGTNPVSRQSRTDSAWLFRSSLIVSSPEKYSDSDDAL